MAKTAAQWNTAVDSRFKSLKRTWLDGAAKVIKIVEAQDDDTPFNIAYSNTETLMPALYNSTPRPEVSRRYTAPGDGRKLDSAVATAGERLLEYAADSNDGEYETFDEATRRAVFSALVPGSGQVRVRLKEEGKYQSICFDSVAHDRFVWAYAKKWKDVNWVAYGIDLNKDDFAEQFPAFAKSDTFTRVNWAMKESETDFEESSSTSDDDGDTRKEPTLLVWEVWSPKDKKILWICEEFKDTFLKEDEYPLPLSTRFPSPEPLKFVRRVNSLTPVPLYQLYQEQAEELNRITKRLNNIIKAVRVRGVYDSRLDEISKVLDADLDNAMIPVQNAAALETGGFDKALWMVPVDMLVQTAMSLYQAREQAKQTIYEILGIGDILRGTSVASETAKAQEIKNQWGSLRVKRMQKDVSFFCVQLFRIAFEFAAHRFSPATLKQITQLPYLFKVEYDALSAKKQQYMVEMQDFQRLTQAFQSAVQEMQQAVQQQKMAPEVAQRELMGMKQQMGEPPQNPIGQQEEFLLTLPTWEAISDVLTDRFERTYKIDVETNSTVDLEATEDKEQIAEFMNAWGQMMSGLSPLIESGQMPFEAAKLIMMEVFRRFRFGRQVEIALDSIQAPEGGGGQAAVQAAEEKAKLEVERAKSEAARKVSEMQETVIEKTGECERLKIQLQQVQSQAANQVDLVKRDSKIETNQMKQDFASKNAAKDMAMQQKEHALMQKDLQVQMRDIVGKHQLQLDQLAAKVEQVGNMDMESGSEDSAEGGEKRETTSMNMVGMQKMHGDLVKELADAQRSFQTMVQQLAAAIMAPRRTELITDPRTGKPTASVSHPVEPSKLN